MEKPSDNRMRFIRLLEGTEPREFCTEFEFASETRIAGQLDYSNGDLILRFLTFEPNRDGLLKYTLSIREAAAYRLPVTQGSDDGYYFGGSLVDEILSLASLFLRSRIFVIASVVRSIGGPPMTKYEYDFSYIQPQRQADRHLFDASLRNFVPLGEFLNEVRKLPEAFHHRFGNSARLYALALREIGVNDQLAYIHLVSAIEILSQDQALPIQRDPLQEVMDKIKALLDEEKSRPEAKAELGNLFKHRKSLARFIAFVSEHSQSSVIEKPQTGFLEYKIYRDTLPDALKRIYTARSNFLHAGAAMYLSDPRKVPPECDYDFSAGQTIDNRKFPEEEKLPNISFFESLVRNCLLEYLKRNSL
jgi:hypothetical protein